MSLLKLQFIVPDEDAPCRCSKCRQEVEMIAKIPLDDMTVNGEKAFVGLCRPCVESLLIGFFRAEARALEEEIAEDVEDVKVPAQ